jgi:5-methylcytosine-specific restriction endonuclease McrA
MAARYLFEPPRAKPKKLAANIKSLLVRCPSTSRLTDTGRTVEEKLWAATKVKTQKFTCAHCGKVHTWAKADVVLGRPLS